MDIYKKYQEINPLTRNNFLEGLTDDEKNILISQMNDYDIENIIVSLGEGLNDFIENLSEENKDIIFSHTPKNFINKYYNNLPEDQKSDFAERMFYLQNDLEEKLANSKTNLNNSENEIINNYNNINTSRKNTEEAKAKIKDTKKEIRDLNKQIKKISKEKERQLKKIMHLSRISIFDKIGFISKAKTNNLINKLNQLENITANLNNTNMKKENTILLNEQAKQTIIDEKQNIYNYQQQIVQNKEQMTIEKRSIKGKEIQIKNVSKAEKKILGRKLYGQITYQKNLVMTQNKVQLRNKEKKSFRVTPTPIEKTTIKVVPTPINQKNNDDKIRKTIQNVTDLLSSLNNMGIEIKPANTNINSEQSAGILENPIGTLSNEDVIILENILEEYGKIMVNTNIQNQSQNIEQAKVRVKAMGFVKASTLITIIFISLISVFIAILLIK